MDEPDNELFLQIEEVFGLGGGELESHPWECKLEGVTGGLHRYKFWYDGVPEYATSDYEDAFDGYRTVITSHTAYPTLEDEEGLWYLQNTYSSSGEAPCGWNDCEPSSGREERPCKMCEAKAGEPHGYINIGTGWVEAVYQQDPVREILEG